MSNVSAFPSRPTVPFGSVGIADGPAAYGLSPLLVPHIKALLERGLEPALLVPLGVGASDRLGGDQVAIGMPYLDGGMVAAIKHRTLIGEKRFTHDKGGRQLLYNIDCLRDPTLNTQWVVITEGELDCMAVLQAGYPRCVSVPGGAPLEPVRGKRAYAFLEQAMPLLAGSQVILATDDDDPGRVLRDDLALRLGRHRCWWLTYPEGCKDLGDVLRLHGPKGVVEAVQTAKQMQIAGVYRLSELPALPEAPAFDTGIVGLREHYKLRLGDLTVVTGIPGHGKSSFINEVCGRMALAHGWRTVFASFEQTPQRDHRRALRSFHSEQLEMLMSPQAKADADAWIEDMFAFIWPDEDVELDLVWLLETLAQAVLRWEAQIVVIDPWNELDHIRPPDQTQTEYVGLAIKTLRKFARKYRVHLIVAAHPAKMQRGKDGSYPIPSLYDISDSAHWNNKPDVGVVVHRQNMADNETQIRVLKTRYSDIGRPGEIKGNWAMERTRYTITSDGSGSFP